jgi:hypothetical protein
MTKPVSRDDRIYLRWVMATAARKLESEGSKVLVVGEVISLLRGALSKTDRRSLGNNRKQAAQ